jgi:hypothetical protein
MTLKFTDRPYGGHGPKSDDWRSRFPADSRPISEAPRNTSQWILGHDVTGETYAMLPYQNGWQRGSPFTDWKTGAVSWRMDGTWVNPVRFSYPRRGR